MSQELAGPVEVVATDMASFTASVIRATRAFDDTRPWWRGQRDARWDLSAGLYRAGFENKEINLNARFRLMARARRPDCPGPGEALPWLFLMQHYRLPTRLLDWTQSPLVALFFALERPDETDASVWALCPTRLNLAEANSEAICMPLSRLVGRLGTQGFRPDGGPRDERILAVLTEEADARHMVQQSAFTLHGRSQPINSSKDAAKFLMRVRIPAGAKEGLRQVMALFGISRAALFPDLENLAAELSQLDFQFPSPPAPLNVDGQVAS
jgi:hypothetical protein